MRKTLDLPKRPCDCGCGISYKPVRRDQRFVNAEHRKRYHAEEMVVVRKTDLLKLLDAFITDQATSRDFEAYDRLKAVLEKK